MWGIFKKFEKAELAEKEVDAILEAGVFAVKE